MSTLGRDEFAEVRQTFDEQGYAIFRNVVSSDALAGLAAQLSEKFEEATRSGSLFSGGGLISGHLNCFPGQGARFVYDALEQRGIVDAINKLMPRLNGMNVGCNFNLPGSVAQHYHVDGPFLEGFMIANVAVVDTDLTNGAIDVVPRTHKKFYKFWRFAAERAQRASTRLPMKRGDVLIRTSNLWHRGMPNFSSRPRPMVALTFGEKVRQHPDDPYQFNGGEIMFRPNWYRPDLLGRLRERTFVKAPITYDAYRFVSSLFGNKGYAV